MRSAILFLDTRSGDMQAFASLEAFEKHYPGYDTSLHNAQGDMIVRTTGKWPDTLGYLQEVAVHGWPAAPA